MGRFFSTVTSPTALLYAFLALAQVASGIYLERELEPPPSFALIYTFGFLWVIGWWLLKDSRKRGVAWVFDMGLFLYLAWPFIMPYYLLKTRGREGAARDPRLRRRLRGGAGGGGDALRPL